MSILFHIRIELVVGPIVWARFEVCHPDQWDVPATKTIALIAIVEVYENMKRGFGFVGQRQPIRQAEASELVADHPQRAKLDRWLELYRQFDGPSFTVEANEAVLEVELVNEVDNPKRADGDPDPKATLVVTMRDSAILAHVKGGFTFDSAMCDCRYWC